MFDSLQEDFSALKDDYQEVQDKLATVMAKADKAQVVGREITNKISEFQVSAEPQINKIKEILEKYQGLANK